MLMNIKHRSNTTMKTIIKVIFVYTSNFQIRWICWKKMKNDMSFGVFGAFQVIVYYFECFCELQCEILYMWTWLNICFNVLNKKEKKLCQSFSPKGNIILHRLRIQAFLFENCSFWAIDPQEEMSVRVQKGSSMVGTLGHEKCLSQPMSYQKLWNYIYRPSVPSSTGRHGRPREAPWRPRENTESSSRAQILARDTESSPLSICFFF